VKSILIKLLLMFAGAIALSASAAAPVGYFIYVQGGERGSPVEFGRDGSIKFGVPADPAYMEGQIAFLDSMQTDMNSAKSDVYRITLPGKKVSCDVIFSSQVGGRMAVKSLSGFSSCPATGILAAAQPIFTPSFNPSAGDGSQDAGR
jgi:hypothetical protein